MFMKITSMRFYIILIVLCILIFLAYLKDLSIFSEVILWHNPERSANHIGANVRTSGQEARVNIANYTKMKFGHVYILGAAGGNTSRNTSWDIYKVYALVSPGIFRGGNLSCCFKYEVESETFEILKHPTMVTHIPYLESYPYSSSLLTACHHTCKNPKQGTVPVGLALTAGKLPCDEQHVTYVRPFLPMREDGVTLALGTKAAYGSVSAEQLIEWMETYKFLGVDKVVMHYLRNINKDALRVLDYYARTNMLELYYHEPAASETFPRIIENAQVQFANDKQMMIFDSFERMSGYTYFGIIDTDEFLIPSVNRSIKQMLADMFNKEPEAAGFFFKSKYYYLSWGPAGNVNDLILGIYINTTSSGPKLDAEKLIYKTHLVSPGAIHTHWINPVHGYKMKVTPTKEGFVRHYRTCRKSQYISDLEDFCLHRYRRVKDTSVAKWSEYIKQSVQNVRQDIFGIKSRIL